MIDETDAAQTEWLAQIGESAIKADYTNFRVSDYLGWSRDGTLDLRPHYQRGSVWTERDKSFLIDSVVHAYPLPLIVVQDEYADNGTLIRRVVDGQQRLRTLIAFIDVALVPDRDERDKFKYTPPELSNHRAQFSYVDLPRSIRERILETKLPTVSLGVKTNDNTVLELYDRLNSTGLGLNAQELRYARRSGAFSDACYRLTRANQTRWTDWKLFNIADITRMREVEFASELVLLTINGIDKTGRREIDESYRRWESSLPNQKHVERAFQQAMDAMDLFLAIPEKNDPFTIFRKKGWFFAAFAATLRVAGHLDGTWRVVKNYSDKSVHEVAHETEIRLRESAQNFKVARNTNAELIRAISGSASDRASRLARANFAFQGELSK
ncbi:DUF262 domain-containing protein [Rhodococcus sovatensis]|uniref:DUF262 domain-containing protein n=1 Tax=Rhodococcus sovatensis TaxID=1805840 RepID=A0ABZ2PN65_9NOCA